MKITRFNYTELIRLSEFNQIHSFLILLNYFTLFVIFCFGIVSSHNILILLIFQILLGLLFAHGLELQHECLHGSMFRSEQLNRIFGFCLGLPMLVSYTHYKCQHLHHHKYLGTAEDAELFDYKESSLKKWNLFLIRAWNLSRLYHFFSSLISFYKGNYPCSIRGQKLQQNALTEYILLSIVLLSALEYELITESYLFIKIWLIPWLLFGEIFHFLIELPEHIGCEKKVEDVTRNTRSVLTTPLIRFIVNSNNYHVEHHLYPKVAFRNLHVIHEEIKSNLCNYSNSYFDFFIKSLPSLSKIK